MDTVIYYKGSAGSDLDVFWEDSDGSLLDLSAGYTFRLTVAKFGAPTAFTKTTGLFGATGDLTTDPQQPNLRVQWASDPSQELGTLEAGAYILHFLATPGVGYPVELYGELIVRENAPNYGYCEAPDLMLGDIRLGSKTNPYDAINNAADEMNATIGQLHTLPLDLSSAPAFVPLLLKKINAFLASGRLIMAQAQGEEMSSLHAYGRDLVKQAQMELDRITRGETVLVNVPRLPGSFRANAPVVINSDTGSAVDAFERFVTGDCWAAWGPGGNAP